ncbi:MAG: DUF4097 family beta strand repeat protein [Woeseiaceae bacterium]|nr:DUF4097 domain-containing protein [Gammaproteobacteria bacterium]NNK24196.1 DUF4097 family beta strand repeat protein [Woeseiaceae bacterium]
MKRLVLVLTGILLAAPAVGESIDKRVDAASDGHVRVSNRAGSVTVAAGSDDEVRVTGDMGRNVEDVIVERDDDVVTIRVKAPKDQNRGISTDLDIRMPAGSSLKIDGVSVDIEVSGVRGEQRLDTVSGDIETEAFAADVEADTVSGDVDISGNGGEAEFVGETVSGDVTLSNLAGQAKAESVSGDVAIEDSKLDRADLETVSGDVVFEAELRPGGRLSAEAVSGGIELEFAGTIAGRFEFDTHNGDIDNCFGPEPQRKSKYTPGMTLHFQEGDGDARVTASTVNGDIEICR